MTINSNRFALSLATAQHYADQAKHDEVLRPFAVARVREELQTIFKMLPETVQTKILEVHAQLTTSSPRPEVRRIRSAADN